MVPPRRRSLPSSPREASHDQPPHLRPGRFPQPGRRPDWSSRELPRPPAFALLRRRGARAEEPVPVELLIGTVTDVRSISAIPLAPTPVETPEGTPPREPGPEVLALVPFRQIRELGFACHDDGTPLRVLRVEESHTLDEADLLAALPDVPVRLDGAGFGLGDRRVLDLLRPHRPGRGRAGRRGGAGRGRARRPHPGRRQPRGARTGAWRRSRDEPDQRHLPLSRRRTGHGQPADLPRGLQGAQRAVDGGGRGAEDALRRRRPGRPAARTLSARDVAPGPHGVRDPGARSQGGARGPQPHHVRRDRHRQSTQERVPRDPCARAVRLRLLRGRPGPVRPGRLGAALARLADHDPYHRHHARRRPAHPRRRDPRT